MLGAVDATRRWKGDSLNLGGQHPSACSSPGTVHSSEPLLPVLAIQNVEVHFYLSTTSLQSA